MYRILSNDRPSVRASQPLCAVDSSAFDFRSFDQCHRPQRKPEHPSVGRPLKIAQIFDKPVHGWVSVPEQNDVLAPRSGVAKLAGRTRTFYQNWNEYFLMKSNLQSQTWGGTYPVLAAPMQSLPANISGMQFCWMGVGCFKPNFVVCLQIHCDSPSDSNVSRFSDISLPKTEFYLDKFNELLVRSSLHQRENNNMC